MAILQPQRFARPVRLLGVGASLDSSVVTQFIILAPVRPRCPAPPPPVHSPATRPQLRALAAVAVVLVVLVVLPQPRDGQDCEGRVQVREELFREVRPYMHAVDSIEISRGLGTETFIRIDKGQPWLLKAMCPDKGAKRVHLQRVTLLDQLRRELLEHVRVGDELDEETVVAEPVADPMARLDALAGESPSTEKSTRGSKYRSKRKKHCVVVLEMPAREPHKYPSCTLTRSVRIYPTSTSTLYIAEPDLEWFLDWVWDELETGGVTRAEETIDDLVPNCVAAGVHIRPDFTSTDLVYEAIVLDGDHKGKVVKSAVAGMTAAKYDKMASLSEYSATFADATREDLKRATRDYLAHYMAGILGFQATPESDSQ